MNLSELLENEKVEKTLSPHPLSFMRFQSLCIFLIVLGIVIGWLANFSSEYSKMFTEYWTVILAWGLVLLIAGIIASLITIRWSIFFLYLITFLGGVGLMIWQGGWLNDAKIFIPFYTLAVSIIGFLFGSPQRNGYAVGSNDMQFLHSFSISNPPEKKSKSKEDIYQ